MTVTFQCEMDEVKKREEHKRYLSALTAIEDNRLEDALAHITKAIFYNSNNVTYYKLRAKVYVQLLDITVRNVKDMNSILCINSLLYLTMSRPPTLIQV